MTKSLAIEFFAGASHEFSFTVAEGTPMDSHQASIEVRRGPGKPVVFHFSTEDGTITRVGQKLTVKLLPEVSVGKAGKYEYQLKITQGSTVVKFTDIVPWTIKTTLNSNG